MDCNLVLGAERRTGRISGHVRCSLLHGQRGGLSLLLEGRGCARVLARAKLGTEHVILYDLPHVLNVSHTMQMSSSRTDFDIYCDLTSYLREALSPMTQIPMTLL